jgi:hypothetical protein
VAEVTAAVEQFATDQRPEIRRYADENVAREILNNLIGTWMRYPEKESLLALQPVCASDDLSNAGARSIVEPWPLRDAALVLVPARLRRTLGLTLKLPRWPEASFSKAAAVTKLLLRFDKATRKFVS